jgi:hypothetical protein
MGERRQICALAPVRLSRRFLDGACMRCAPHDRK